MSQYLDKDGASRIAENFLSKQAEQDAILTNLQFDLKEAEHALVKTIQGPAPLNIRALTRPLDDYRISGNMVQNGTPTPTSPIYPEECGDKTDNLWDEDYNGISGNLTYVPVYVGNGSFTLSTSCPIVDGAAALFFLAGNVRSGASSASNGVYKDRSITVASLSGYVTIVYRRVSYSSGSADPRNEQTMLNLGSTALPYEPYGYKLPISCGGTTTNVYLGETQSTRSIKKLVFDGTEGWTSSQSDDKRFFFITLAEPDYIKIDGGIVCSHFEQAVISANNSDIGIGPGGTTQIRIRPENAGAQSSADFSSWVATQYSAGTPVTVWYVLAEPGTTTLNEPIRKIGDYADTISMAQAGVEISTTKGFNTITTDTIVLPSNIEVKGVINNA